MICPDAIKITPYLLAQRFIGVKEAAGRVANPAILGMLQLDGAQVEDDATPWCSAFVNYIMWLLRLPRSKSLRARSWLEVGQPIHLRDAEPGFDVVILARGDQRPGAGVINAPGHVGFVGGRASDPEPDWIAVLGGNQGDAVSVRSYPLTSVLGIRRVWA